MESAYLQLRDLRDSLNPKEKIGNSGRILISKTPNKNDEQQFDEHSRFLNSEAYSNIKTIIFEIFSDDDLLFTILQKLPQFGQSLFEFFLENFFNPFSNLHESSFRSNFLLIRLLKEEIPFLKINFEDEPFSLKFLIFFFKENAFMQSFLKKITEKCLKFLLSNKENLEIHPTRIKEHFKNRHTIHSQRPCIKDQVFHKYKPDAIFHDETCSPSKTMGFLTRDDPIPKNEFDNFEMDLIEETDNESLAKSINTSIKIELKEFNDPQMIRFRKKNIEIIKKSIDLLLEGFEDGINLLPKTCSHLLNELIKEYANKGDKFLILGYFFMEYGVLRQINEDFEDFDMKGKMKLNSFLRVVSKIVRDETSDEIEDFEDFTNKKKEKLADIYYRMLNLHQVCKEKENKIEKCQLETFMLNLETADRLTNYIIENEGNFGNCPRIVKYAKKLIFLYIFFY